jgi:hypothetical protein
VKTPKHPTNSKVNFSLIIAFFSLGLAGFGVWYNSLRGADIKASLGGPVAFHWTGGLPPPGAPPPPPNSFVPAGMMIVATVDFANNGAQTGEIKALTLELRDDKDGTRWVFIPAMLVTDVQGLKNSWAKNQMREASRKEPTLEEQMQALDRKDVWSSFHSVLLPGKQTTSQTYVFRSSDEVSKNLVVGPPHTFGVTLYSLAAGDDEFRAQDKGTLVLTPTLTGFISTTPTVEVGFEEEGRAFRRTFEQH